MSNIEQVLATTPHEKPTIRPLASHHETIQLRRTRHAGHCWRSKDELISDVLLWTPTYGQKNAEQPTQTYIQQLCEDTGGNPEDLPEAINNRRSGKRGSGISVLAARHDDDDDEIIDIVKILTRNQSRFQCLKEKCEYDKRKIRYHKLWQGHKKQRLKNHVKFGI